MTGNGMLEWLDGAPSVDTELGDAALVRAMLDVEVALARAASGAGLVSPEAAEAVARAAAELDIDAGDLGRESVQAGNPVVPLVRELAASVPLAAQPAVHPGATSQDVLDTALMLLVRRALIPLRAHLARAGDAAAAWAESHRDTLMLARTLGQPAQPTTFGLRAACWLAGIDAAYAGLERLHDDVLAVQLGGAAGTLAGQAGRGLDMMDHVASELGLAAPATPWHTERSRIHALGTALATTVTACGKVAADVVGQSSGPGAELAEGGRGGSSAMPHKQNPVTSVLVLAAARRAPGLVATLLGSGVHEQERATGSWHAEWPALRELVRLAGGAAAGVASILAELSVDTAAMRQHVRAAGPGVMSEALASVLVPVLGRAGAHEAVREALAEAPAGGRDLVVALRRDPAIADALSEEELVARLDPASWLGSAGALVDRHLHRHASHAAGPSRRSDPSDDHEH
ncbi:3-carboxy-cis,cis-muconate cycloisomerase [Actinobacteria bacterium YIM 96077]|uniref:3-carboxy-cis,cis-muconate cycloisomerase n=1 Tax=Phytoactinopolyspora halophila TaxID=1981511 RepID=A0A329QRM2_9ACTN|nr:lyase family protein [Phytoactinopolyspora halophila]AYY14601.1 3-carboxy-cis,cis-muconate cycloisomerase [Actinobacteria bacterium YIM 96077]RAW14022.1 3-carboxy-cis,cis-muconate cycloisomerase [Phytoactinopolyspora halophila]